MTEEVILVNENDEPSGTMEKMEAHRRGLLHRAFSVFIFNTRGELLLQRRAWSKYHSGGLWTNTCCSHPRPGEDILAAASRRLGEEMGLSCPLTQAFSFVYRAEFSNGLTEHEYDYVFTGVTDLEPVINPGEVAEWKYLSWDKLRKDITDRPQEYTEWFRICFEKAFDNIRPGSEKP